MGDAAVAIRTERVRKRYERLVAAGRTQHLAGTASNDIAEEPAPIEEEEEARGGARFAAFMGSAP